MDALKRWAKPASADITDPLPSVIHHVCVIFDDSQEKQASAVPKYADGSVLHRW